MSFLSLNLLQNALGFATQQSNVALYVDTVKVLTGNILDPVSILDCKVTDDSQITNHPVESGAKISEHQIFNPVEIDMLASAKKKHKTGATLASIALIITGVLLFILVMTLAIGAQL